MRIWFAIVSLLSPMLFGDALTSEQNFKVAQEMLRRENFSSVPTVLSEIKRDSVHFPWAIVEAGKVYYRLERWTEFFGIASYVRNSLPTTVETERLRLLETLGFLRHCRTEEAKQLIAETLETALPQNKKNFQTLADLLDVAPTAPDADTGEDQTPRNAVKIPRRQLWPIPATKSANLNPFQMRRKVESLCKKEATP